LYISLNDVILYGAIMKDSSNKEDFVINCVGVDDKLHVCLPWDDKTFCGEKIKNKKVKPEDFLLRFSCYECTY